jgi:hypothetical protein
VTGAAICISADLLVSNHTGALAVLSIGARTNSANIYSASCAVGWGDGGNSGNIYAGAAVSIAANVAVKNIYSLAAVTLGASSNSLDVFAAAAITGKGANSKTASASTAPTLNLYKETFDIDAALEQMASAQVNLSSLETDFILGVGMGDYIFEAGVHSGTALTIAANSIIQFDGKDEENPIWVINLDAALVTGVGTAFEIINAGAWASIIRNKCYLVFRRCAKYWCW